MRRIVCGTVKIAAVAVAAWSLTGPQAAAAGGLLAGLYWEAPLDRPEVWTPQPGWLSNVDPSAGVRAVKTGLAFRVPRAGRGMKWSRRMRPVWLPESPFLVLRYRARNVDTAQEVYAVYLDDGGGPRELHAVRLNQLETDGKWRRVAVDVRALAASNSVVAVAVQVQAAAPHAVFEIAELAFADTAPPDCTLLDAAEQKAAASRPDLHVPLARLSWVKRPSWLGDPAPDTADVSPASHPRFVVPFPGRGMKWHALLDQAVPLASYGYATFRYRANGLKPNRDYAVCVLGDRDAGGQGYTDLIALDALVADGRPHTLVADISGAARRIPIARALAVQVQAAAPGAFLEVLDLRFSQRRPVLALSDLVPIRTNAEFPAGELAPLSVRNPVMYDLGPVLAHLGTRGWPGPGTVAVDGVPFRLGPAPPRAPGISLRGAGQMQVAAHGRARELYLFVIAVLAGAEEPVYGGGRFETIADRDRFLVRLTYADGPSVEALPLNLGSGKCELRNGPQVLCVPADPDRELLGVQLDLRSTQAAVALCAVTARRSGQVKWPPSPPLLALPPARPTPASQPVRVTVTPGRVQLSCAAFAAELTLRPVPRLVRFRDLVSKRDLVSERGAPPLAELFVRKPGKTAMGLKLAGRPEPVAGGVRLTCADKAFPGLRVVLTVRAAARDGVRPDRLEFRAELERTTGEAPLPGLRFPRLGPFTLGTVPEDVWVMFPSRGSVFTNRDCGLSGYYSGLFPLQFMAAAAPTANQGVCLLTEDREGTDERRYELRKEGAAVRLALEYPPFTDPTRTRRSTPTAWVAPTGGDWRAGFSLYRKWVRTWYRPAAPRREWFREVFNFRQRFLHSHDPLYDPKAGKIDLTRALEEGKAFGGIEYLHLFDWGKCGEYGRIYGRVGDYSPYDFLEGGREALQGAIAAVQKRGVRVGLYIEGYLLQEKGRLGRAHGKEWQLRGPDGEGRYWPGSTEMFICPGVRAWQRIQADTYAAKVRELGVSGMYMDQFGFANPAKRCWAPNHGHPIPSFPVRTERQCAREVRRAVDAAKPGVALYSEETPCDVNSQFQDGSFSYAVRQAFLHRNTVPINLFRFAIPSFKVFQILVCDKPTASFASGVAATFFNGDGLWLEGPAAEWFRPRTLAMIRRCHRILRDHRTAFTCHQPEPLVPTVAPGVFANRFDGPDETVFTLYNSASVSYSGPVLRLRRIRGATYTDAWHGRTLRPAIAGDRAVLSVNLGPRSVGCIIRRAARAAPPGP